MNVLDFILMVKQEKVELSKSVNDEDDDEKARFNALYGWDLSSLEESLEKAKTYADIDRAFNEFVEGERGS